MSFGIQKIELNDALVLSWKCELSLPELMSGTQLSSIEKEKMDSFTHDNRKKEFLGIRFLLQQYDHRLSIHYDMEGRPLLNNHLNLSVSHSHGALMLGISKREIGIDTELIRDKIVRIQHKFLHIVEQHFANDIEKLTYLWSIKESVFKHYSKSTFLEFSKEIKVNLNEFSQKGSAVVHIDNEIIRESLRVDYFRDETHVYAYTVID